MAFNLVIKTKDETFNRDFEYADQAVDFAGDVAVRGLWLNPQNHPVESTEERIERLRLIPPHRVMELVIKRHSEEETE
jgi:hypothetical protein